MNEMVRRVADAIRPYLEDSVTEPEGAALAAIDALRGPSAAMVFAGHKAGAPHMDEGPGGSGGIWRAMIDQALKP